MPTHCATNHVIKVLAEMCRSSSQTYPDTHPDRATGQGDKQIDRRTDTQTA